MSRDDEKIYEKNIKVRHIHAGRNHGALKPVDPLWISTWSTSLPCLMSLKEAREFANQLVDLCDAIEKERAEAKKITPVNIEDGAVFYADGKDWRKVIELHDMRFVVVDRFGTVHKKLCSAVEMAAHANEWNYRKEKQA
jgi:hypothetical protein